MGYRRRAKRACSMAWRRYWPGLVLIVGAALAILLMGVTR
jgi:hypothetical protein